MFSGCSFEQPRQTPALRSRREADGRVSLQIMHLGDVGLQVVCHAKLLEFCFEILRAVVAWYYRFLVRSQVNYFCLGSE